ncbi:hypothetical protein PRIC2_000931 [Phytophthora ramorum]
MRFFGYSKRQTRGLDAKLPPPPASLQSSAGPKETTIVYSGGALSVTLQRAKSRFLEDEGPTRLVWSKNQRLGLTFVEMPQGGVAVKDVPGMRSDVSPGQELIGVGKVSVVGMSLQAVVDLLQNASSPCVLNFTPPPSPIVASEVLGPARLLGVRQGMVLRSANGSSMIGAKLSDLCTPKPILPIKKKVLNSLVLGYGIRSALAQSSPPFLFKRKPNVTEDGEPGSTATTLGIVESPSRRYQS